MRHVSLTCKNHPNLRWQCKSCATSEHGGYNGCRNIFFNGDVTMVASDGHFLHDSKVVECECPPSELILAPGEVWDEECQQAARGFF